MSDLVIRLLGRLRSLGWFAAMVTVILLPGRAVGQDAASIAAAAQASGQSVTADQVRKYLDGQRQGPGVQGEQETEEVITNPEFQPAAPGLSSVELLLSGQSPTDVNTVLKQFGYNVFDKPVSTFAPLRNVPVGSGYLIGPGDSFTVTTWGRHNDQMTLTVGRDGKIAIPEVGVLSVTGMTFEKLESYLESEFQRKFTDFKMHIAMDRLRTIQVYVVGEARALGTYTLSSLSTVINALFFAGGPAKNGTMRRVRLLRAGRPPVELDLYDFLMAGDRSNDERLQDGDTIAIPLIGPVVGVAGSVKRPAIYEMKDALTLRQALELAGGVTYAGYLQHIQIERVENHKRRIVADFDLSDLMSSDTPDPDVLDARDLIQDGDLVTVFPISDGDQNVIYLAGHVRRQGKYEFKPGLRLKDLLGYNVFLPQVNLEYAEIERLVPPDFHPIVLPFNLGKLLEGDATENIELSRFDTVRLFRWDEKAKQAVFVTGMVYEPGEYRYIPGMRLSELVDSAGGLRKNTYQGKAEITRRHVTQDGVATEKIDVNLEKALQGDPTHNLLLQDYDHLVVRPIPDLVFDQTVEVLGEVRFPGVYPIKKSEALSSVIERAGGYTSEAYLKGAVFTRESAKAIQQERMDDLIRQLEGSLLTVSTGSISAALDSEAAAMEKASLEAKQALVGRLRSAGIDGRVVVKLTAMDEFRDSMFDLRLEDGDVLTIPETPGIVSVIGDVFNPTALLYEKDATVGDYLSKVGGITKEADKKQISVIKADGSVISKSQKKRNMIAWDNENKWWHADSFMETRLYPGDTIVVPRKLDRVPWLRTTSTLTQILFQTAIAAGVVLAL